MKVQNRQQFLVILTVAVVGLAAVVNFILPPVQDWWSSRQMQIKQLGDKVRDGNALLKSESRIRSRWTDMRDNALPANTSDAEQHFLKSVDSWARASGAEITSLMPQWKNDSTNYMTLNCRVETSGDINALSKFIYNVEHGQGVRLNALELSSHDNNGQQMTLGLEINGLALLQNDKK